MLALVSAGCGQKPSSGNVERVQPQHWPHSGSVSLSFSLRPLINQLIYFCGLKNKQRKNEHLSTVTHVYNPSTWRNGKGDPWSLLVRQLSHMDELQVLRETSISKPKWGDEGRHRLSASGFHTRMHTHPCTHGYTPPHTYITHTHTHAVGVESEVSMG